MTLFTTIGKMHSWLLVGHELLKHRKRWSELMKGSLKVTNLEMRVLFPYTPSSQCLISFYLIPGHLFWSCLLCMCFFLLLSSSHSSLACCWSVSLFLPINFPLLLQGQCHLSNKQQTLHVMDAPHREKEKVVVHGQTRHLVRLPHGMMVARDDGFACYMAVWVVCLKTHVDILRDL